MSQPGNTTFNRNVNHIAFAVPDCESAVAWYGQLLGFRMITQTFMDIDRTQDPDNAIFDIYPPALQKAKIAIMTSGNGVAVEFFQFIEPSLEQPARFEITRGGVFHIAVTDPDPEGLCSRIVAAGGRRIGQTVSPFPVRSDGIKDCALYTQDPWGNVIEIVSCSLEHLMANRS